MKIKFDLQDSTIYGGTITYLDYLQQKIKLKDKIHFTLKKHKAKNATYSLSDIIIQGIISYTIGLERPYHFQDIEYDPLIPKRLGLKKLPDHTLYYKNLRKFKDIEDISQLKELNSSVIKLDDELVVDFDSSVVSVYGQQEDAEVGYNPHKSGRKSYHPIFAYERKRGFCINAKLRPGNVFTSNGFKDFFEETQRLTNNKIKTVCSDKGFSSNENLSYLDDKGIRYICKLREMSNLFGINLDFKDIEEDISVGSIIYRLPSWDRERRIVFIRKRVEEKQEQQISLFDDFI